MSDQGSEIGHGVVCLHMRDQFFLNEIKKGTNKKGDVLGVARIAAIQAAKKTSDMIPLCHLIFITNIEVDFRFPTLVVKSSF